MTAIAQCGNDEPFEDWTLPAPSVPVADGVVPVPPLVLVPPLLLSAESDEATDAADADEAEAADAADTDATDAADDADAAEADDADDAEDIEATTKSANVVSGVRDNQL